MKNIYLLLCTGLLLVGCRKENPEPQPTNNPDDETVVDVGYSRYPKPYQEVLLAHGGLDQWKKMRSLTYTMPNENGDEVQTVDLQSRNILVETDQYKMGSDGDTLWIDQDSTYFNPDRVEFYHNLMFYFYAMPFVLADDGIQYSAVEPLTIDGTSYPGMKVSYEPNIGASPEDEYLLFMDPDTKKMAWLGYTVTYGKDEKSDPYSFIKYDKWKEINGLKLTEELVWYQVEDNKPIKPAGPPRRFTKIDIDVAPMDSAMYRKPATAIAVKRRS